MKKALPEQCSLLEDLGYLVCDASQEDLIVTVPVEISEVFHQLEREGFTERKARYDLLDSYAMAAVHLYGAISQPDLVGIFNRQNSQPTSEEELFPALLRHVAVGAPYCFWEEYIVCGEFEENDFEDVRDLMRQCGGKPRYIPEKDALLHYADGEKRYILAPLGVKQGDVIVSGEKADIKPGNALPMARIPVGTVLHNIELNPGRGGQFCRAAGTYAQLVAKEGKYALLRMPSGEVRKVLATCLATIGQVGNIQHENISLGKAGRNRWLGRRPKVRGVAMNPVDHPLGGGEGRSSGGRHPVSPWGMPTKGYKTRDKKKPSSRLIVKRRGQK